MEQKNNLVPEFPEVIVVEASAGSGKTYALAKRYLQLIINPHVALEQIPLRSILAITFTNKATVEMKERILELLKKIVLDSFSSKDEEADIFKELKVDKKTARSRADLIMELIVRHYNFFQVQTIDSFINNLLLGSALNIERSANFKIKRDYADYLSYCLDLVIEEAFTDEEVYEFLEGFLKHYLFVENRTGWFPREDILNLIRSFFRITNRCGLAFSLYPQESSDVIKQKNIIFSKIKELVLEMPSGMNKTAYNTIVRFIDSDNNTFDIKSLPNKFKSASVPMNKGAKAPADYQKRWERIHEEIKKLVDIDSKVAYKPYLRLFNRLLDYFQDVSKKEDILFLEELNRKGRSLFDEGITVAEIYYRLATRFWHYLIDEFQDTSTLQWINLEPMIQEALSSGGSLFYVGDKKQAIYRFRGGEAKLFDELKEGLENFNVKVEHLRKNWRSQKAIVEFNNMVFSKENIKKALGDCKISKKLDGDPTAIDDILSVFEDSHQSYKKENEFGYVSVERIDEKNQSQRDELIKEKLLAQVNSLIERFSAQDIALLCRDNREVELVTSWLLEAGFAVESEKTLNVLANPAIKEIVSFLSFLHSPINDLFFASFILGDIFAKKTGLSRDKINGFIFSLHKEDKLNKGIPLYRFFRDEFSDVWEKSIEGFFRSVGFVSPYELVTSIYQCFDVHNNFSWLQAFFMKFLELIKTKEQDCIGLEEFLDYLGDPQEEDLYVNVTHSNAIKVLTIHKSKGLEFGVVIIPFLRMDIEPATGEKGTNSYIVPDPGQGLKLIRITEEHRAYSDFLQKIYAKSYKNACIDELNNIYVALTRAKFELYIFLPKKSGSANNKACFLIPPDVRELGKKRKYSTEAQLSPPNIDIAQSTYKDWLSSLKDEFIDRSKIKNREKVKEGEFLHTVLSHIGDCRGKNPDEIIEEAFSYEQAKFAMFEDLPSYKAKIKEMIMKKALKDVFFTHAAEVFCEKEIVNRFGDLKRIDRLIIWAEKAWIIDYKSSSDSQKEHGQQVKEYIQIIKDVYPDRSVQGFLLYLDKLVLEEVV